ncbi:hypothetical protein C8J56DRAFT_927725 [Mycena floridula]|nr:hypothetical protein C8J56DRAFT_927725 [Mycena floridula]
MLARRALRAQSSISLQARRYAHEEHHHPEDTTEYPKEPGFLTTNWLIAVVLGAGFYGACKYAPAPGEDSKLTKWIQSSMTPAATWTEINAKHTMQAHYEADTRLLLATAERPAVHRYQFPQAFENVSPFNRGVGMDVDLGNLTVKRDH